MNQESHVLVTGATGFVGSYILRDLLKKGYTQITALRRATSRMGLVADIQDKINWVEADLFDYDILLTSLADVDVVIHSAAKISFIKSEFDHMKRVNVEGTAHILNASIDQGVKQFLFVSSIAALGRSVDNLVVTEKNQFQHTKLDTGYGLTKHLAEMEVWRAGSEGLNVTIINPAMIMGAGYWDTGTAKLIDTVNSHLSYYPVGKSGFVDVRDVSRMAIQMLEQQIMNTRMMCCGASMKIQDMIGLISHALDKKPPTIPLKPWLRALAWRGEWFRSKITGSTQLITRETLATSAHDFILDASKSKDELGFEYTPLALTITETCKLYSISQQHGTDFGILPTLD